ncbi:MAG: hemerythrin domain-containing protein [Firmicutes bacterium]|nr:hemerythrin domain-containing protein [Bacillota bacterium]
MSGPSLWQAAAHQAVHEAQETEVAQGLAWLAAFNRRQDPAAARVAAALVETWNQRVLAHLTAEEDDLYPWLRQARPQVRGLLDQLAAEHAALTRAVAAARAALEEKGPDAVAAVLEPALDLLRRHARREESLLASPAAAVPVWPVRAHS